MVPPLPIIIIVRISICKFPHFDIVSILHDDPMPNRHLNKKRSYVSMHIHTYDLILLR